jgi:glyoxylate reductase
MADSIAWSELQERLADQYQLVPWCEQPTLEYADVRGVFTYGHPVIDASLIERLPALRVISNFGVGVDHIDVAAAAQRGVRVGNTPEVLDAAVAELGMLLLLGAARRLSAAAEFYRGWQTGPPRVSLGTDLHGQTLGIVGLGRIGLEVARRAAAFGMHVVYHNRRPSPAGERIGCAYRSFSQLLAESDFVILTVPLTPATERLIDSAALAQLKPTAQLVNVARGAIVDTEALTQALERGQLAGAALDVTDPEPLPAEHPLRSMPNVLITPHLGSATLETRRAMADLALENLSAGLRGEPLTREIDRTELGAVPSEAE